MDTPHVGKTTADGRLAKNIDQEIPAVVNELLSREAVLLISHYDYDYVFTGESDSGPITSQNRSTCFDEVLTGRAEERRVILNGRELQEIAAPAGSGSNNSGNGEYSLGAYRVPIDIVKFPEPGTNGNPPTPPDNVLEIAIDGAEFNDVTWSGRVDWAVLFFRTVSPVVLVHGNASDPGVWNRRGLADRLVEKGWPIDGCDSQPVLPGGVVCSNPVVLPNPIPPPNQPGGASIYQNARHLAADLPKIADSLGVSRLNLVAHSKGGLDARHYLASHFKPPPDGSFQVISLTTLGTPHDGSVGADIQIMEQARTKYMASLDPEFENFPEVFFDVFLDALLAAQIANNGTPDLQTSFAQPFNSLNLPALPPIFAYNVVAADADKDRVGPDEVDQVPEWIEMKEEAPPNAQSKPNLLFGLGMKQLYRVLRDVQSVDVKIDKRTFTFVAVRGGPTANDLLVTAPSALGYGGFFSKTAIALPALDGPEGKNHSSIMDEVVADRLYSDILKPTTVRLTARRLDATHRQTGS